MLTFRMDETNFAEGDRVGVRIVTGAGLKVDFDEFADDDDTLGLWHLHDGTCQDEGTGLEDESGNGHDFTNHGAESVEDGYRFVCDDGDYIEAAFTGQAEQSQMTFECWIRDWHMEPTSFWTYRSIINFFKTEADRVQIEAIRRTPSTGSRIVARLYVDGVQVGFTLWEGTAVDDLLAGGGLWHLAVVLDAPNSFDLYVNGVRRGQDTTDIVALPAGDYTLRLGRRYDGNPDYDLDAVLDEVRLSSAARYAAEFAPQRLLEAGTYASTTFDGVRIAADWTDLVCCQSVPPGCSTTWDVRADDESDAGGHPQAPWQPYGGDPATLPDGRYFQWRAALSASDNRLASPTIESVEAQVSEAGYNLYHATGPGPEALGYAAPWARLGPSVNEIETEALDAAAVHWFGIRPVDADDRESPISQGEIRLEIDAEGEREPDRPAGALAAAAAPLPLGAARLQWRYRVGLGGVLPQTFRIFGDGGTGTIDYETPLDEVPWREGQSWYAWTSQPLTPGVEHQLAVRAVTAGEVWDEQPAVARVTPDAAPPGEVDALEAEITA